MITKNLPNLVVFLGTLGCGASTATTPATTVAVEVSQPLPEDAATEPVSENVRTFFVWYPDSTLPEFQQSCGALSATQRQMSSEAWSALEVMKMLLAGPTVDERSRGLLDPFGPSTTFGREPDRLGAHLRSVSIDGAVAVLDFAPPAMSWLNGPACVQESVKTPMLRTLKELFGVDTVEFAVNGTIVKDWDA
jgi:hypothetical protein